MPIYGFLFFEESVAVLYPAPDGHPTNSARRWFWRRYRNPEYLANRGNAGPKSNPFNNLPKRLCLI